MIAKGKKIAAHLLEAADTDIEFENGVFKVAGTDKSVPFASVSLTAYVPHNYPLDKLEPGLNETAFYDPTNFTYPAGTHICEVEIDPDTGHVEVVKYTMVGDFGTVINPLLVDETGALLVDAGALDHNLRTMSDEDLRSIWRYVRSLGPAGEPAPAYVPPGQMPAGPVVLFPGP